jgi:hypothetical protein
MLLRQGVFVRPEMLRGRLLRRQVLLREGQQDLRLRRPGRCLLREVLPGQG